MSNKKFEILTFVAYYLPGYKAGGPIRTVANMVDRLGDEFHFKIITADRDFGDGKAYPDIKIDDWNRVGKAAVFYMALGRRSLRDFGQLLATTRYDILYLNSFFSPQFTIKPLILRRLRLIPNRPLVIAPRGEFSPGALELKSFKKKAYIKVAKAAGLYKDCLWQASSQHEKLDIQRSVGENIRIAIAPNIPPIIKHAVEGDGMGRAKARGRLNVVFVSRISRKKNLDGALKMLKGLTGEVEFNIYGPKEDREYWRECQDIVRSLPDNINVNYRGSIAHVEVSRAMKGHHLFLLPTLGENFGHVILEALSAGCPVLISDQTPWQGLAQEQAGWDISISDVGSFRKILQELLDMDHDTWKRWSNGARKRAEKFVSSPEVTDANRRLFYDAFKG